MLYDVIRVNYLAAEVVLLSVFLSVSWSPFV